MERFKLSYTRSTRQKIIITLAAIIVFVTTYALILPAITIDTDTAEKEPGIDVGAVDTVELPAASLEKSVEGITVSVEADAGVFPENTSLSLKVEDSDDTTLQPLLESAVQGKIERYEAVDIAFENENGDAVAPQDAFTVKMISDSMTQDADRVLVQVSGDVATVVDSSEFTYKQVEFSATEDATYAIVEKSELTSEYLSADGNTYEVTVTYDYTAQIPDGAKLDITEYTENSDVYASARKVFMNAMPEGETPAATDGEEAAATEADTLFMDLVDLTIHAEDGSVVEPAASVRVSVKRKNLPENIDNSEGGFVVQHLNESGDAPFVENIDSAVIVANDGLTASFETDSFSYYAFTWTINGYQYRTARIHYGYLNGSNQFIEFDNNQLSQTPTLNTSNEYAYLIYDVDYYKYKTTYYNNTNETNSPVRPTISGNSYIETDPLIRFTNGRWNYWNGSSFEAMSYGSGQNRFSDIYVVYEPMDAVTHGGTAKTYESEVKTPDPPSLSKESVNNHDGTRDISLSIDGHATPIEVEKLADVIVIFDTSGSMKYNMDGSQTSGVATNNQRITIGSNAIKGLADELLSEEYHNKEGNPQIRMSLITFSTNAQAVTLSQSDKAITNDDGSYWQNYPDYNFTSDPNKFKALLNNVSADGGTNWEQALQIANRLSVDPDRDTFIIFVSDGDPTFRVSRSPSDLNADAKIKTDTFNSGDYVYQYYRDNAVFGQGNNDSSGYNYAGALNEARSIVEQGKKLYCIGISQEVSNMQRLTDDAGAGEGHCFSVNNESELKAAFEDIKRSITGHVGWSSVNVSDGITGMTNMVGKVNLTGMNTTDFRYKKEVKLRDEEGNVIGTEVTEPWDPTSENCLPATYDSNTGAVVWNMGPNFQLADDTTYTVTFTVWPNQHAIDIVTDLNNGLITLDDLPADEREQIAVETKNGFSVYTLKTNTELGMSYYPSRKNGEGITITDDEVIEKSNLPYDVEPLVMQSIPIRISKQWFDSLTGGEDQQDEVTLKLWRRPVGGTEDDWEAYPVYYKTPEGEMEYTNELRLSLGNKWNAGEFYVSPGLKDKYGRTLDQGYEFSVTEPGIDYHYELDGEIMNPILQGYGEYDPDLNVDPAMYNVRDVYIVRDYNGTLDDDSTLLAGNVVKGGIYLRKDVVDPTSPDVSQEDDTEFVIHGSILDPDGNPYTFNMAWDDRTDVSGVNDAGEDWKAHQNDPIAFHIIDRDGNRIGYKMHVASTDNFEVRLKSGQQIRFVNVPKDCTYIFWEDDADMPQNYKLYSVNGYNVTKNDAGDYVPYNDGQPPVLGEASVSGTVNGNVQHNVEFKNTHVRPGSLIIKKVVTKSDGTTPLYPDDDFTFSLRVRYSSTVYMTNASYTVTDENGDFVRDGTFSSLQNNTTFTLKAGQSIEIFDVPNNYQYRVTETAPAANSGYTFVNVTGAAASSTGANVQNPPAVASGYDGRRIAGTMHSNEEHDILYTNRIDQDPTELQIAKVDANDNSIKVNGATFMLYTDANHNNVATDYLGEEIGPITTGGQNVADGIGYIGNLWAGTYYLVETGPPGGYLPLSDHVIINVGSDGTVTVTNPDNAAATGAGSVTVANGLVTVAIPNVPVNTEPLPSTGGRGTALFYISGGALILAAVWIYIFRFRRGKGGKRRPEFP